MKYLIDYWFKAIQGKITERKLFKKLAKSYPPFVSVAFTRECGMECKHCAYPKCDFQDIALNDLARIDRVIDAIQKTGVKDLIHVGRILKAEHISILKKYQDSGMSINLIDNGSSARLIPEIKKAGLFFDGGIDISIDGDKISHDFQRCSGSYDMAISGVEKLQEVADHISITGTASALNYASIVFGLIDLHKIIPFSEIFQITTTSPARPHTQRMHLGSKEMQELFHQFEKAAKKSSKIRMLIYLLEDLTAVLPDLKKYGRPETKYISLQWKVGKTIFEFFPQSIVTAEEFAIDANGRHIMPFGLDWHLSNRPEEWEMRDDSILTNPNESYENLVRKYQKTIGEKNFRKEKKVLNSFLL